MHISRKFGLLTVALVVALGISPAHAYKGAEGVKAALLNLAKARRRTPAE